MTISHLDVKVYNTIAIHNNMCNISTCLNCLPFKSQQFRARQMRPRFFAHQLAQGPFETVDHLPSDPKHSEFFLLDTASPARCPVQMQGKASLSCRVVHANWLFLNPYLKMCSGLSYIFYLKNLSCIPELLPKHCSGVERVRLWSLCIQWAVSYCSVKTKAFLK